MTIQDRRSQISVLGTVALLLLVASRTLASEPVHNITTLAVDPVTPSTIYAGTADAGVYATSDSGDTWTALGPTASLAQTSAIAPTTPPTLYAAVTTHGVFRSSNGGGSWENVGLSGYWVDRIVVDPQTPTT